MKLRTLLLILGLSLIPTVASAQISNPCVAPVGTSDTILTGVRPWVTWTVGPTEVVGGFYVTINTGILPKTDIGKPAPVVTCPDGSIAYRYQLPTAPPKGSYTALVSVWNLKVDGSRQEGPSSTRPFDVVDETVLPLAPGKLKVSQ